SPTMDELGRRMANRMRDDAASPSATIGPGAVIIVRGCASRTVPLTGVCTVASEIYAGDPVAYIDLAPGAERQLSLNGCASGSGGDGAAGGAGGMVGVGGAGGAGGI